MKKICFLYTELAGYMVHCMNELAKYCEVLVFHWPINKEAPFHFKPEYNLRLSNRQGLSDEVILNKVKEFNPDLIVCSGWADKDYIKVILKLKSDCLKVITLDNHWNGGIKQNIAAIIGNLFLSKWFNYVWIPGKPQYSYAKNLGFENVRIKQGFYCCNDKYFTLVADDRLENKAFGKRVFLYVGRYVKHKGIFDLWKAFTDISNNYPDWELWCAGTGEEFENRINHPNIKHLGFIQPNELNEVMKQAACYVLPSHFEPWGVSVHEAACAGFPLILSNKVGSTTQFLEHQKNGFLFESGNVNQLAKAMSDFILLSESDKKEFEVHSIKLAGQLTADKWIGTINEMLN